ncbi:DegT/DnrJ/EryC1/StrS family aminotransferase [Riemerella anatipestifer]|uniref:DegT/DnrJ/EryC1/StrS family aminotransferase n=1 Tax=Riemerella anatipestifer TaxID=34085 RepID=UPI0030BD350F
MLNVTKTYLPPIEEYMSFVQRAYDKAWLTNRGELVLELEKKLKKYLNVKNIVLTTNGTLPIQIAIKALNLKGEIITTPFSYVATTSSIVWENCKPVFVDIEPDYLTIDPLKIESAITSDTTAILATHVFGNPCDVEAIEKIAKRYGLKVVYDAAHAFGVTYKGESLFSYGDVSTCSFHATKIFHCGEGGCMIANDEELMHRLFYMHNFGHETPTSFYDVGINAKMSELQAAMGLAVYNHYDEILNGRKRAVDLYLSLLEGTGVEVLKIRENTEWNYHYFPVVFRTEEELLRVQKEMNNKNIFPRRYFYPSLNTLNYVDYVPTPISESISRRVLCLPLFDSISKKEILKVTNIIREIC